MMTLRKDQDRGHVDAGWLQSKHSFSFGRYHDADHMGFSDLRVINQDVIAPGTGFGTHPHQDMEILTYVLEGELEHMDSMGNRHVLKAGEFQRMTAGTGVTHSEKNPDADRPVHMLQIWVTPNEVGLDPGYEELPIDDLQPGLTLIAGDGGALTIHQDTRIFAGKLSTGAHADLSLDAGRKAWVQMISGTLDVNGQSLSAGDGLSVQDLDHLTFTAQDEAHFLVFDLR